ncbi:nucleoside phosphorylase [Diplocloster agilis]|uniref:Uridine phosphorylase n=1 Tax=Diplocloster agilis TaxID=2850323 RepID=A0A949NGS5_9FIRM|nr:nucleoside phosphorylase [Diplocloster agilis]MBU9736953.1 nucleoside phosphorylase [Diplocloster agilis]
MSNLQAHIRLSEVDGAKYAILPGDPRRIDHIREFLTDVKELAYNRELRSISGYYKGLKILAVSTGMGGASTGIAVEELHNIGVETMIRIGSCGALDKRIGLGALLLVNGAVRDDGASKTYIDSIYPAIPDTRLLTGTILAAEKLSIRYFTGMARSHDSFYTDREEEICEYWAKKGVLGSDMETAALFTIGGLRGIRTASILNNVVLYGNDVEAGIGRYADGDELMRQGETNEILVALETIAMESKNEA